MFKKTTLIVLSIFMSLVLISCDSNPKDEVTISTSNKKDVKTDNKNNSQKNSEYIEAINKALAEDKKMGCINNGIMSVYGKSSTYINYRDGDDSFEKIGFSTRIKKGLAGGYEYELTEKGKEAFNEQNFCFKGADIKVNEILTTNGSTNEFGEQVIKLSFTYLVENKADWVKNEALKDDEYIQDFFLSEKKKSIYATLIFKDNGWQVKFDDTIPSRIF